MMQDRMQQNRDHQLCTGRYIKAARVMDVLSRLPGCAGQAADTVSANTQIQMEDAPTLFKKIQSQNVQMFGYVNQNTNGQNHGPAWKSQSFLLSEICTVILW